MGYRKQLIIVHTVLAAFFLPMGIMYAITGGLYGLGLKGGYDTVETELQLTQPLDGELSTLAKLAEDELEKQGISPPTGSASVKKGGTSYFFEWTGAVRDVQLHPTDDPLVAQFKVKDTDIQRYFVQLHKAKAGEVFKWFAAVWMVGLVALFLTGGVMAFAAKPYRKMATVAAVAGVAMFVVLAMLS
ncbi:MAG: hypothetical protein AB8C95_15905 [Phycisphaeraceae bacterium]